MRYLVGGPKHECFFIPYDYPILIINQINNLWENNGIVYCWLVVSTNPSEKYESVGMMPFPTEWKIIIFHGSKPPTRYLINKY